MVDLKETLDAACDAFDNAPTSIDRMHKYTKLVALLYKLFRTGALIVKPDRDAVREKVARALCAENIAPGYEDAWEEWLGDADAALSALFPEEPA